MAAISTFFTLPSELRGLGRAFSREVLDALLRAASETMLDLGRSRLGGSIGITMVLHTWTRKLEFHPHVHGLVTAGGLHPNGSDWITTSDKYLFPVEVMRLVFRAKMLAALGSLHARGKFALFADFADPEGFAHLMRRIAVKHWVLYAKKPFRKVEHVLRYLGRYTHRVAIANSRLVDVTDTSVSFRTKEGKILELSPVEFLRRFVQHVLPDGFHKIRHYGLYSASGAIKREVARDRLSPDRPEPSECAPSLDASWHEQLRVTTGRDVTRCPFCDGSMIASMPIPRQQGPPLRGAA